MGALVRNLILIGAPASWGLTAVLARGLLGLSWSLSILLGAILVVTGPTVIIPLLRYVRLTSRMSSALKWEGIIIDPVGALLALLVFEVLLAGGFQQAALVTTTALVKTILVAVGLSAAGSFLLIVLLKRRGIPDFLQNSMTLAYS